jgi:hypothetical protein
MISKRRENIRRSGIYRKMDKEWASDKPAYHVIFKDGKLVDSGSGTVRVKDRDGNVIMFVPY